MGLKEASRGLHLPVACGLAAGGAAVLFLHLTNLLYRRTLVAAAELGVLKFSILSLAIISTAMLMVGVLCRFSKGAAGSGIPELKAAYWNDMGFLPWRAAWVKLLAGVISLGGGASLGREGPTVFISAAVASSLAGRLGVKKHQRRLACVAGSAAGLAAAFNTPLAATTFVLEEVIGDLNSRYLGPALLAAVIGAFVTHSAVGSQPAFLVPATSAITWRAYILIPIAAAAAAVVGLAFQQATLFLRSRVRAKSRMQPWLRPLTGGLITWAIGLTVFVITGRLGVFSLGYDDLSTAMTQGAPWTLALLLLAAKLPATIASYAWGGCGGIFSPLLFMGGMTGFAVAGLAQEYLALSADESVLLACVGMSACFGAAVRAPLTALIMIFEMTHLFAILPGLMLGTLVSQFIARRAGSLNFYEAILQQDGHELSRINPPRDIEAWQNQPVSAIMNKRPVVLRSLEPAEARLVLVRHQYKAFPVESNGRYTGVAFRDDLMAMIGGEPPRLRQALVCEESQSIRDTAAAMLSASMGHAVILEQRSGAVRGFLTLHDLLREQARAAE